MHQRLSEQVILIGWLWMKKIFLLVHLYFVHLYYEQNSVLSSSTPCPQHPSITSRFKHLVFLHPDHLFHPASIILALIDISFGLERQFERQPVDIDIREERSMLWKPRETKLFIGSAGGGNNALFVFLPSYNNLWVPFTILAKTTTTMFILFLPDLYYHKPFCTLFSSINPSAMFVCLETFDWCSAIFESFLCCWLSAVVKKTLTCLLLATSKQAACQHHQFSSRALLHPTINKYLCYYFCIRHFESKTSICITCEFELLIMWKIVRQ